MPWVALVGPEIEENLSLRYLAACLERAGFPCQILPFHSDHQFTEVVRGVLEADEPPLMVGLSLAFQWRAPDMLALAVALREGGYSGHITAGGHFATFAAKELMVDFTELDSVVRQEAEDTLTALAAALSMGDDLDALPGLALRGPDGVHLTAQPANPDLARLPWPDRRGTPASCLGHPIAPLISSRGCYANCSFCCIAAWHEQSLPGKRYRLRQLDDVADEMAQQHHDRGIEVFVFHDDNFFVPGRQKNLERIDTLADLLAARGVHRFATVVKARPVDVRPDVFRALKHRLNCIRAYVGVESDADQGLETLRRWARPGQNQRAIDEVRRLDLYVCFNLLIFDPDTTIDSLRTNLAFMDYAREFPFNFGRVELYAGTPLLARMQQEGRCRGDYLQWDYDLRDERIERVFQLTMATFRPRNFGDQALANHIMGTRFDMEVARHFHPEACDPTWQPRALALSSALTRDTVAHLTAIVDRVATGTPAATDAAFIEHHAAQMRAVETQLWAGCRTLAAELADRIGGVPLTLSGDVPATPLQEARP